MIFYLKLVLLLFKRFILIFDLNYFIALVLLFKYKLLLDLNVFLINFIYINIEFFQASDNIYIRKVIFDIDNLLNYIINNINRSKE